MLPFQTPPLIQTLSLSLHDAHIALPADPSLLAKSHTPNGPVPLQVSLMSSDVSEISSNRTMTMRFSVFSSPAGVRCICLSTEPRATQLRVILQGNTPATLAWLSSCFYSEKIKIHVHDLERGRDLAIEAPLEIPDLSELMGVLCEPKSLTDHQRHHGMAWLVRQLSGPGDLGPEKETPVRRVVLCAPGATELAMLLPDLGIRGGVGDYPRQ